MVRRHSEAAAGRWADLFARKVGLAAQAVLAAVVLAAAGPGHRGPLHAVAAACLGTWALVELTVWAVVRARPAATGVQSRPWPACSFFRPARGRPGWSWPCRRGRGCRPSGRWPATSAWP